jgi:serine/threonine protein kinase
MNPERWNKINEVFVAWLDLEGEEKNTFLMEACGSDSDLRKEVQQLIDAHLQSESFIETPICEQAVQAVAAEDNLLQIGQELGVYRITKEIGRGGMGAVYLAERADQQYKKRVAIKLIKRGMDTDQVLRRFRNERQILAGFDHPNIARLLEGGSTSSGLPYFIMEYVEGLPIDRYCDESNLSITKRLELFRQVCAAVSYAHRNLVIHRDIKPGNILVTAEGIPKLLDFGIAKILMPHEDEHSTVTGLLLMTPEYASPEQAHAGNITTLSDIYSLGILLYELLTGHSPYQLKRVPALEVARIITETKPQIPSVVVNNITEDLTPESVSKCREGTPERLRRRLRGDLDNIVLMAIRKEPQRRYQSVEQFSEDIRRHLEGHPVLARKDTFLYRATKFIRRNKVAAAFAFLALISIIVAGISRWRTNQQAATFQEFGQEVTRMEAIMRYAYLLPLHNIEPEKKKVIDRIQQINQRMQTLGSQGYGPGHYAIGRGYLALHRYQEAYDHLIQAWKIYDYHQPAVANALGLSLAMLYQEKLRQSESFFSKDQLQKQKEELEKKYRDPALQFIKFGASVSEEPEYVKAIIAFLEKHYEESLKQTEITNQKTSWLYESKVLQGQILTAVGNDQAAIGKTDLATRSYEKAEKAYLEAAKKGQSDPEVYGGLCSLLVQMILLKMTHTGTSPEQIHREGISYCDQALMADSQYIPAYLSVSKNYVHWGYYQRTHGQSLRDSAMKAVQAVQSALKINSEDSMAYLMLGNAYSSIADEEYEKEGDPIPYLDLADANLKIAVQKSPEDSSALYNQGSTFLTRARVELSSGKDPRQSLEKAIASLKKAISQSPKNHIFFGELGIAYWTKARYEIDTDLDQTDSLNNSITFYKKCTDINPDYMLGYTFSAAAYLYLADFQMERGDDPIPALDHAIAVYNQTFKVDPENAYSFAGVGYAFWKKGEWLYRNGQDPNPSLQLARDAIQKSIRSNKNLLECYSMNAEVEILGARYAIDHGGSPDEFFKRSEKIINDAFQSIPKLLKGWAHLHRFVYCVLTISRK